MDIDVRVPRLQRETTATVTATKPEDMSLADFTRMVIAWREEARPLVVEYARFSRLARWLIQIVIIFVGFWWGWLISSAVYGEGVGQAWLIFSLIAFVVFGAATIYVAIVRPSRIMDQLDALSARIANEYDIPDGSVEGAEAPS